MSSADREIVELFDQPPATAVPEHLGQSVLAAVERLGRLRERVIGIASLSGAAVTAIIVAAVAQPLMAALGGAPFVIFAAVVTTLAAAVLVCGARLIEAS